MKTDGEIKNILKNLPEHRLPDNFRESVMDAVKRTAIFDALEYKSVKTPIKKPRYLLRYAGLIAAVLVLGIMWISGMLRESYGLDENNFVIHFAVPEAAVEHGVDEDMRYFGAFDDADTMPFVMPDEVMANIEEDTTLSDDAIMFRTTTMLAMDLELEDHNRSWLPTDFIIIIYILVSIGVLFGIAAFLIHLKRSKR